MRNHLLAASLLLMTATVARADTYEYARLSIPGGTSEGFVAWDGPGSAEHPHGIADCIALARKLAKNDALDPSNDDGWDIKVLNALGRDGWDIIHIRNTDHGTPGRYLLKRTIPSAGK